MRRVVLASWVLVLCCWCCIACGRRVRGGTGIPRDSGSDNDAGATDASNADASADASADATPHDAASVSDAALDAATDANTDAAVAPTPPDANCDAADFNGHTYWFCTDNRDWDTARGLCVAINGDLVSINESNEQAFVESNAPLGTWLIGLNKKNGSGSSAIGTWEMVDGTTLASYENWGLSEPDADDCGAISGTGAWQDVTCTNDENWICEIP